MAFPHVAALQDDFYLAMVARPALEREPRQGGGRLRLKLDLAFLPDNRAAAAGGILHGTDAVLDTPGVFAYDIGNDDNGPGAFHRLEPYLHIGVRCHFFPLSIL